MHCCAVGQAGGDASLQDCRGRGLPGAAPHLLCNTGIAGLIRALPCTTMRALCTWTSTTLANSRGEAQLPGPCFLNTWSYVAPLYPARQPAPGCPNSAELAVYISCLEVQKTLLQRPLL